MVIVQDPETARYDGMPRAAIAAGVADYVKAPQDMPASLIEYVRQSHGMAAEKRRDMIERQSSDMQKIFSIIRLRTKRDFSGYKLSTLKRRIERRMSVNRIEDTARLRAIRRRQPTGNGGALQGPPDQRHAILPGRGPPSSC